MKMSQVFKDFKGRKRSQVERRGGRRWERRAKRVACHLQIPRHYRTLPWASREGRIETWPYQKPDQNRTRIRVLCQEEMIGLQSSAQAEALRPDSCVWDWGTRKKDRIGRVKERKERQKGREVSKVSCSLPSRGVTICCRKGDSFQGLKWAL